MTGLLDIRPAERRGAMVAFATLAAIMVSHSLLETARDAMFLATLPASKLPWVYLLIAALGVAVTRITGRHSLTGRGLSAWLLVSAAISAGLWFLSGRNDIWILYAVYVWPGLFSTVAIVQLWGLLSKQFTVTEAKRVFGLVATGGILGAIVGSGVARAMANWDMRHVVLIAAGCLAVTSLMPIWVERAARDAEPAPDGEPKEPMTLRAAFEHIASQPYARQIAAMILAASVGFTLLDYVFKSVVVAKIEPHQLGAFFATFNLAVNVAALLAQLVIVSLMMRTMSLAIALSVPPLLFAGGGVLIALGGALAAAIAVKAADGALRHSLHRTAIEVLYVPMSDQLRAALKPVIDVLGQRGGQAAASLVILAVVAFTDQPTPIAAGILAVVAAVWLVIALRVRPLYMDLFRKTLDDFVVRTRVDFPDLDMESLEQLIGKLSSPSDGEVIAVIDLLVANKRSRLLPDLILYHPSARVVGAALDVFGAEHRRSFLPLARRLLRHDNPSIRAAALCAVVAVERDRTLARAGCDDEAPEVIATAWACCVYAGEEVEPAAEICRRLRAHGRSAESALAHAIRRLPSEGCLDALEILARSPDPAVRIEVARAAREVRDARLVPALIAMLGERATRPPARAALVAIGAPALGALDRALDEKLLPQRVRHHIPRTISRFTPVAASRILLEHMPRERDDIVRYKLLRGLGRVVAENPRIRIDRELVKRMIDTEVGNAYRLLHWRLALSSHPEQDAGGEELSLLLALLADMQRKALEHTFRLVGVLYPREHMQHIYRVLLGDDRHAKATGWELLGGLLKGRLRTSMLALIDDIPDEQRMTSATPYYEPSPIAYDECLDAMARDYDDEALRALAVSLAGKPASEPASEQAVDETEVRDAAI